MPAGQGRTQQEPAARLLQARPGQSQSQALSGQGQDLARQAGDGGRSRECIPFLHMPGKDTHPWEQASDAYGQMRDAADGTPLYACAQQGIAGPHNDSGCIRPSLTEA